jgi:chromosome segregation ATPase
MLKGKRKKYIDLRLLTMKTRVASHFNAGGAISCVEVKNFMCHSNLRVDFAPNINFITGQNGSGKSAIVAAISLCFGCRAASTFRGKSADAFVKTGCHCAEIRVTISNGTPPNSYRFEDYGSFICIERVIRADGPSVFRTRAETGRVIESKKDEVGHICDFFGIRVDNPLVLLTQDLAKRFLATSDEASLYDFFMEATFMKHLEEDYSYSAARIHAITDSLSSLERKRDNLCSSVNEFQRLVNYANGIFKSKDSEILLEAALAYKEIEIIANEVSRITCEIEALEESVHEKNQAISGLDGDLIKLDSDSKQGFLREYSLKRNEVKVQIRSLSAKKIELASRLHTTKEDLKTLVLSIRELELKVKKPQTRSCSSEETQDLLLTDISLKLASLEEESSSLASRKLDLETRLARLKIDAQTISKERDDLQQNIEHPRRRPDVLPDSSTFTRVQLAIEASKHKFAQVPVGPIKDFISLSQQQWKLAVDACIGSYLDHYIVSSHRDREILSDIFKSLSVNYPVLVINSGQRPRNISHTPSVPNVTPIMSILEITSQVVFCALLIFEGLDRIGVSENKYEVVSYLKCHPMGNLHAIFTPLDKIVTSGNSVATFKLFPSQNSRFIAITQHNGPDGMAARLKDFEANRSQLIRSIDVLERDLGEVMKRIATVRIDKGKLQLQVEHVKQSQAMLSSAFLEEEQASKEEYLQTSKEQLAALGQSIKSIQQEVDASELLAGEKRNELAQLETEHESVVNGLAQQDMKEQNLRKMLSECHMNVRSLSKQKEEKAGALNAKNDTLSREQSFFNAKFSSISAADVVGLCAGLSKEQIRLQIRRQREECQELQRHLEGWSPLELTNELMSKRESLEELETVVSESLALKKRLELAAKKRLENLSLFKDLISKSADSEFRSTMSTRGFEGALNFNHENCTMTIDMKSLKTDKQYDDIRQLSGGEKSFGTSCFFISLWDSIYSPFRCLDEFDVFMVYFH